MTGKRVRGHWREGDTSGSLTCMGWGLDNYGIGVEVLLLGWVDVCGKFPPPEKRPRPVESMSILAVVSGC